ncbi:oligosaccharide flippase family protein [Stenotrophomonas lactitubi]
MIEFIRNKLKGGSGKTAKAATTVVLANVARLAAQALYFVAFARSVGPDTFAHFSAAMALSIIMSPFIGLGSGALIVKRCSRDPSTLSSYYGSALAFTLGTLFIASPAYLLILNGSLGPGGWAIATAVLLSELLATKLQEITVQAFQSQSRINAVAGATILTSLFRIAAAALGFLIAEDSLGIWLSLYMASAIIPCAIYVSVFIKNYGIKRRLHTAEIFDGLKFSLGISSQGIYNDADKLIMPRLASADISGNYAAAYKIVDVAFSPVRALLTVTYPGFFKAGANGISESLAYSRKYLPVTVGLGLIGSMGIFACSGMTTWILGQDYEQTATILKYLAIIPLLRSFHFLMADAMTGADYQGIRSVIQIIVAGANIAGNIILIPQLGWKGAAFVSIACDATLCLLLYATAVGLRNRESNAHG